MAVSSLQARQCCQQSPVMKGLWPARALDCTATSYMPPVWPYQVEMSSYLKNDLKVKTLVSNGNERCCPELICHSDSRLQHMG